MGLKMKFKGVVLAVAYVVAAIPFFAHGQTKGALVGIIEQLNATAYRMTALDKALMDFNIQHAYSFDANIKGSPIIWNHIISKFQTNYYIPPNSALLKISSKDQLIQFESNINGIRITLAQALTGVPIIGGGVKAGELFSEMGKILEVQFATNEGNQFYIIAMFKDGKLQLVREKMK
ncbi:MAG: hypothetical protein KKD99_09455 [Proteobacteria bacterium]|nr:hypothetical protein [Pseudomonadota bacterium]MBU4448802.1 hypothetical protein [Pseudomonadota bacterium]MCG2770823.1 hypothetical protein [Desulfobacterales bacterium]